MVGEGVVVFEAVLEHELGAFLGGFPPALNCQLMGFGLAWL
jgi:hypothetical protein